MRIRHLTVIAVAMAGSTGGAQTNAPGTQRPPSKFVRSTQTPFTSESHELNVTTDKDGKVVTQEWRHLSANDSQGRRLFVSTNVRGGYSGTTVQDPVAGERRVWTSNSMEMVVLRNVVPVADRRSCWKVEKVESRPPYPQIGIPWIECLPAGIGTEFGYCATPSVAAPRETPLRAVEESAQKTCVQLLHSMVNSDTNEKIEDLGNNIIRGWQAHGCRITSEMQSPKGQRIRELWIAAVEGGHVTMRSISEQPTTLGGTSKQTVEVEVLRMGEPDETMFQPPQGYSRRVLATTEIPCESVMPNGQVTTGAAAQ